MKFHVTLPVLFGPRCPSLLSTKHLWNKKLTRFSERPVCHVHFRDTNAGQIGASEHMFTLLEIFLKESFILIVDKVNLLAKVRTFVVDPLQPTQRYLDKDSKASPTSPDVICR